VVLTLRFASGALGSVLVGWTEAQDPPIYTLDVLSTEIALHLQCEPVFRLEGRARGALVDEHGTVDPRVSTIDRFLEAVERGDRGRVPCSPADAFGTLATALACEQALVSGATVGVEAL
jgi:predicted dehydrogenase